MDAGQPAAEAVAVNHDRIIGVGNNDQIRDFVGRTTKVHDVKGATILPGFIDCHNHLIAYGLSLRGLDLRGARSIFEMKKQIADRTRSSANWILGRGWDQEKFTEARYPTRRDLDEASPEKPVLLWRICGHICVVNSAALSQAGIDSTTRDPAGGIIDRDSTGEPTGILRENAVAMADKAIPPLTPDDYEEATIAACHRALEAGLTSVHCITGSEMELKTLLKLRAEGRLPLRFYVFFPVEQLKAAINLGLRSGPGDEWVRIGGVKLFTDGSLGARTAALAQPYADDPENRGVTIYTQAELNEIIGEAHRGDIQIATHAIGDRAIGMAVEAYEKAFDSTPRRGLRHRIEHVSVIDPNLTKRMKKLGLIASIQPRFIVSDTWIPERLGAERAALTYPFASLLRAGVMLLGGSDCPVEPLTPLSGIEAAVNRKGPEAVTVNDAIAFYTRNAAYASFDENTKGTIAVGKLADLVILNKDPRMVSPATISRVRVLTTMVGGRIAHPRASRA
jgi:predicted amidohydrolase YtcJ